MCHKHTEELSAGLGRGTNQLGELWAIGMVLEDIEAKVRTGYDPPAHGIILTDSKYAKGCLGEDWDAKGANAPLVAGLRALWRPAPSLGPSSGSPGTRMWPGMTRRTPLRFGAPSGARPLADSPSSTLGL